MPFGGLGPALGGGEVGADQREMKPGRLADVALERRGQEPVGLVEATEVDEVLGGIANTEQAMGELDAGAPARFGAGERHLDRLLEATVRAEQARQIGVGESDPLRIAGVLRDGERLAQACESLVAPAEVRGAQAKRIQQL